MKKILLILLILGICSSGYAADIKITALPEDTSPTADDLTITVNDPGGTPQTRKATLANMKTLFLNGNSATASALAGNGTNCSAGSFPLGVDASGNSESCTVGALAATTLTAGAGLSGGGDLSTNRSFATDSSEADFFKSGALVCGAATQGKAQVHTTPLQYCDNAATPVLQYAAYGSSTGIATSATALAANGANCSAGNYPLGVDASGASESCTASPSAAATYITQVAESSLSAEQSLASLSSGIMRVATTTGVITSLTDSAGIASNLSDETGSGVIMFNTSPKIITSLLDTNGNELFKFTATSSAVDELTIANAATGGTPTISVTADSDTNVSLGLTPKGTGGVIITSSNTNPSTITNGLQVGGAFTNTGTGSIGWSVVAGANTACNTTCTNACVFGFDTGLGGSDLVDCSDATADRCLCAGAN